MRCDLLRARRELDAPVLGVGYRWSSVRSSPVVIALVALAALLPCRAASAQGLAARFGHLRAVEGEPFEVRIELEDPGCAKGGELPCLLDTIGRVEVEVRALGGEWQSAIAAQDPSGSWWRATFPASALPRRTEPKRAAKIEVRARVIGTRGGVVLELGGDEPLDVEVVTAPEARAEDKLVGTHAVEEALTLVGYVGAEGRAGTSARARVVIGVGARASSRTEIVVSVAVGPAFAEPALLEGGGPIVLGFDGAARFFTRDPAAVDLTLFFEPFVAADLRLPGVDPGVGVRAGVAYSLSRDVGVEGAIGGSVVLFRASDPDDRSSELGATGGLRVALRFGGRGERP